MNFDLGEKCERDLSSPLGPGEDEGEEWKSSQRSSRVARGLRHMLPSLVWRVTETAQKKTPLYDEHVRRGAKMVPFAGWLMPVQYTSIVEEHQAVRKNVGMFDISHMGQLIVDDSDSRSWLNRMLTNNIDKLEVGQGQYTFLLKERGGIIDDLIAYRIGDKKFLLVVNASRTDEDFEWLDGHRANNVRLGDRSAHFGGVAIQGPRVTELFVNVPARNHIVDLAADFCVRRIDVRHTDAPVQARRKRAAGHFADPLAIFENRVVWSRRRTFIYHFEGN